MNPRPSFDLLAPVYHLLERITYGPLLHWCRTAYLDRLLSCRRALILGDGDGRFLVDLLTANRSIVVDSLEISAGMHALARRRVAAYGQTSRVRFLFADARSTEWPDTKYDLIVTNFFLDCFPAHELAPLIDRVAAVSAADAVWLDGDFRIPPGKWTRRAARILLAGMYLFFGMTTRIPAQRLTDPAPFLRVNGFALASESTRLRGFLSSQVWKRKSSIPTGIPQGTPSGWEVTVMEV